MESFYETKYCQRYNPVAKKFNTRDSLVWRYLTRNREKVEQLIYWQIHSDSCKFWWDNWLGNGSLTNYCYNISSLNNISVSTFLAEDKWNERVVRQHVPQELVPTILQTYINYKTGIADTAIWIPEESGKFSIASAWETIRKKRNIDPINNMVWHKKIPFKVAFFIWRALRRKLPTNEILQKISKAEADCFCCYSKGKDDINHILITGHFARYISKYHAVKVGAVQEQINLRSLLLYWSNLSTQNEVHKLLIYI